MVPMLPAVGLALAIGVLLATAAQALPPTRPLTHEFGQLVSLVGAGMLWWISRREARGSGPQPAALALARVVALGMGAWLVQVLTSTLLWDCRIADGGVYFWVTWLPLGLAGHVGGTASRRLDRRGHGALVIAIVALDLATVGIQGLRGLRLVDPLLGLPQLADQRADMALAPVHVLQRCWLGGLALLVHQLDRQGLRKSAVFAGVFALVSVLGGSHLGVGVGKGALESGLDQVVDTQHLRIRYASDGYVGPYVPGIAARAEWTLDELSRRWGIHPEDTIELRIYDSSEHMRAETGIEASHAGPFWVDIVLHSALSDTLEHELVHAQHVQWSMRPRLLLMRGVLEGTAKAWEEQLDRVPAAHETQAAALANGDLPSAADFMRIGGFFRVNEGNAYTSAGSFVGWLIQAHGVDAWAAFQTSFDWHATYGRSLEELDAEWRAFLADVPVDLAARSEAAERFDPELRPAYLDQQCPKVGSLTRSLERDAEQLARVGAYGPAEVAYQTLFTEQPSARLLHQRVSVLQLAGRHGDALALLDAHGAIATEAHDQDTLLDDRVKVLLHIGDFVALDRAMAARLAVRAEAGDDVTALRRTRAALRDPELQEGVAGLLTARSHAQSQHRARALAEQFPARPEVWAFLLEYGVTLSASRRWVSLPPWVRSENDAAMAVLEVSDFDCKLWRDRLHDVMRVAVDTGDGPTFERVAGLVTGQCSNDSLLTAWLDLERERQVWWAAHPPASF